MTTTEAKKTTGISGRIDQPSPASVQGREERENRPDEDDVGSILRNSGHRIRSLPSGITLGVRLEAVPGTHSVHVDVAHIVDLRSGKAWKTNIGMMAAVLGYVNRPLRSILEDVGLEESLREEPLPTPWGRIRLPTLLVQSRKTSSIVVETRWVYVVYKDIRPAADLSWLTDTKRVLSIADLALSRQSDIRSSAAKLRNGVASNKVSLIRGAAVNGWYGVLGLLAALGGMIIASVVGIEHPTAITVPLVLAGAAGVAAIRLLSTSRSRFNELLLALKAEDTRVSEVGDSVKTKKSAAENQDLLGLLQDLSFVVSPLMVMAVEALKAGDVDRAVSSACCVLDECVRLAPYPGDDVEPLLGGTDDGLRRFLGFMRHLGAKTEEENLAVAYVGLTGHLSSPITFGEVVDHMTSLTNVLYDIGALSPDAKEKLDNVMNTWAMKTVANQLEQSLSSTDESTPIPSPPEVRLGAEPRLGQSVTIGGRVDREGDVKQTMGLIRSTSDPHAASLSADKMKETAILPIQESLDKPDRPKPLDSDDRGPAEKARDILTIEAKKRNKTDLGLETLKPPTEAVVGHTVDGRVGKGEENDGNTDV
jgi:hypothetical protein